MNKKWFSELGRAAMAIGILVAITSKQTAIAETLQYEIVGDQFEFVNGDTWAITGGDMSWQLFDVFPMGNAELAVYEVTGLSIEAVDLLGTGHTITVVPDGLPSPFFGTGIPGFDPDSGLVNVYSDGFLDMIVYDLSIDGQPVNQSDILGGPAFLAAWLGSFPEPTSFSVSQMADFPSQNLFGDMSLAGEFEFVPLPRGILNNPGLDNPGLRGELPPGLRDGLPQRSHHSVPEPTSGVLLLLGCGIWGSRRRLQLSRL